MISSDIDGSSSAFTGQDRRGGDDPFAAFNAQFEADPLYLEPGDVAFSMRENDMLVATLGAGVLVSIYEVDLKVGAMAYILLPEEILNAFPHFDNVDPALMRKSMAIIEDCIGEMKRRGAGKGRIRVRLIGGAQLLGDGFDIGTKNYVFVKEALSRKKIPIFNEDIGGEAVRRVHFFPRTGRVVRRILRRRSDSDLIREAEAYFQKNITSYT